VGNKAKQITNSTLLNQREKIEIRAMLLFSELEYKLNVSSILKLQSLFVISKTDNIHLRISPFLPRVSREWLDRVGNGNMFKMAPMI